MLPDSRYFLAVLWRSGTGKVKRSLSYSKVLSVLEINCSSTDEVILIGREAVALKYKIYIIYITHITLKVIEDQKLLVIIIICCNKNQ